MEIVLLYGCYDPFLLIILNVSMIVGKKSEFSAFCLSSSAFQAFHARINTFYFAAECSDEMN